MKKLIAILIVNLGLCGNLSFGHDIPVHRLITRNAAESAYADSSAYASFFDVISSDYTYQSATNSMNDGSAWEDNRDVDVNGNVDVGGKRSLNHFYDPINKNGLTDPAPIGRSSFDWASVSNCPGTNFNFILTENLNTSNIWSWPNARGYEWLGLTATNRSDRQTALTNMFRAVGQVMHLLEDTSQPQHVRNEEHLDQLLKMDLRSRSAIEDYGFNHSTNLNYAHGMLDWRGDGFTQLKDFWDRDFLRTSGRTALNADTNGGSSTLGLAEFTSGNFIGQRAVYAEFVPTNDIHYFAFPSLADTTQPNLQLGNLWGTATHGNVTLANFHQGTRLYISKTNAGVQVTYHSALSYLVAQHPDKSPGLPILTIADDNVLSNYHNIFIPKAVQYSAGLLDYYFRGTLGVNGTYDDSSHQYTFIVTNTSGQSFSGGAFYLLAEDANTITRTIVRTNALSGTLSSGSSTTITNPGPAPGTNFIVVYKGTIGVSGTTPLDPVDAGIGIAAKYVGLPCDCAGASTNLAGLVWYFTLADPVSTASGASGTLVNFNGGLNHETFVYTTFCNPTVNDITIHCAVVLNGWYLTEAPDAVFFDGFGGIGGDFDFIAPANSVTEISFEYPIDSSYSPGTGSMSFTLSIP